MIIKDTKWSPYGGTGLTGSTSIDGYIYSILIQPDSGNIDPFHWEVKLSWEYDLDGVRFFYMFKVDGNSADLDVAKRHSMDGATRIAKQILRGIMIRSGHAYEENNGGLAF